VTFRLHADATFEADDLDGAFAQLGWHFNSLTKDADFDYQLEHDGTIELRRIDNEITDD
jgi:hypothetical protein